ncbi:MAG: hypothetical protein H7Z17_08685 [Fuerstia sp.]|nr:hypothetical protein [Fuerstiella sp.]
MAIKFRCPHCRQLLGISTTKAGTLVDCPACGRSVLVPNDGSVTTKTAQTSKTGDHPGLLSALQELSALGSPDDDESGPPAISKAVPRARRLPVARVPAGDSDSSVTSDRDAMRIIPLTSATEDKTARISATAVLAELAELPTVDDSAPQIVPDELESDLTSALQELAEAAPGVEPHPTAALPSATGRFSLLSLMLVLPAFAAGLFLGTFWQSSDHPDAAKANPKFDVAPAVVVPPPAAGERQLKGIVRYVDDSGNSAADAGAVVLLLPTENTTTLRFDARALRESADSKARQAIEAALRILGGSVHQADDSGTWNANVPSDVALSMIVVSRHRSRTDSQPVPAEILESLSRWFDSPMHIAGRLAVKQSLVPAGSGSDNLQPESLEIEFSSR